ncbi:MAG: hypothetical protein JWM85_858 [Acidimicrobiaceae bacterium]|nr:hypothetical protein [Acidimicrobiaceae bacterium]
MGKRAAGLLLHRRGRDGLEVLLVHPGGPFWRNKDEAAWSIPKGEHGEEDDPLVEAEREFAEELGRPAPAGERFDLGVVRQSSGKLVHAFALGADFDCTETTSNEAEVEWPPRSGRIVRFPEVDKVAWFRADVARTKLIRAQAELLDRLEELLEHRGQGAAS